MKAVSMACLSILTGNADCVLAGGVESMSKIPYTLDLRNGIHTKVKDQLSDGLLDAVTNETPMQITEIFNKEHGYTREQLDEYAKLSCQRALKAQENKNNFC
jgi:acetyl-CoA C-acetyltransferase